MYYDIVESGKRIKEMRKKAGLTQAQLAEMAAAGRASVATARAWVAGKQKPNKASMALLAAHFNMPEDKLFSPGHFDNANTEEL